MATEIVGRVEDEAERATEPEPEADRTGRGRLASNVLWSWGTHLVFVVAGFVMPRMIDAHLGQTALGVWDFGWSLIAYFRLAQIGIGASVNRYVAKYRARGDIEGLRCVVASVQLLQLATASIVLLLTAAVTWALPSLFGHRLGAYVDETRWVVALLGGSLAIQLSLDTFDGVLTGCHRWDLHYGVEAGFYAATVGGMLAALHAGGGLRSLALANLVGVVATELTRTPLAYRVCPGLSAHPRHARWPQARRMLLYGGKLSVIGLARVILMQGNSMMIAAYLGPASLALYSRPGALVRHVENFANKFANLLTPTASSLQGKGDMHEVRQFFLDSSRVGAYLTLPMVLFLAILGDPVLRLWMGRRYEEGLVLAILASGYMLPLAQQSVTKILAGLNLHGRVGFWSLAAAVLGLGLGVLMIGILDWGLVGGAAAVAVAYGTCNGLVIPQYACRRLGIPFGRYVRRTMLGPLASLAPFAACLVASRVFLADRPALAVLSGCAAGTLTLAPVYWYQVATPGMRARIASELGRRTGGTVSSGREDPAG